MDNMDNVPTLRIGKTIDSNRSSSVLNMSDDKMEDVAHNNFEAKPHNKFVKQRLKFPLSAIAVQIVFLILLGRYSGYPDDGNSTLRRQCDLRKIAEAAALTTTTTPQPPTFGLGLSVNFTFRERASDVVETIDCSVFDAKDEPINVFGPPYQDAQFFIVTGLTLLFLAVRNHNMTTFTMCMFTLSICLQWAFLTRGLIRLDGPIKPSPDVFVITVFFAAAVMISWGVVLGRTSPMQVLVMSMLEIPAATANDYLLLDVFKVNDPGGALIYNMFGTYFGLGVSKMLHRKGEGLFLEKRASTTYAENFAYIGTTILWSFWPTAMGAIFTGSTRVRCILNTYFALTGSGVVGIVFSALLDPHGKFSNPHIQNAILAGAVAMSGAADTMMGLYSAVIVGILAGMTSVFTWVYVQPMLAKRFNIVDTCGSHTLHGTPAVVGVIVSAITASLADQNTYGSSLYSLFPAMAPMENTTELTQIQAVWPDVKPGIGRSSAMQGWYQLMAMVTTFLIALTCGLITGFVMRQKVFDPLPLDDYYSDVPNFNLPEEDELRESFKTRLDYLPKVEGADNRGLVLDAGEVVTKF